MSCFDSYKFHVLNSTDSILVNNLDLEPTIKLFYTNVRTIRLLLGVLVSWNDFMLSHPTIMQHIPAYIIMPVLKSKCVSKFMTKCGPKFRNKYGSKLRNKNGPKAE